MNMKSLRSGVLKFGMLAIAVALISIPFASHAQVNYALTATATHSGGGAGVYGPSNYNDQVISTGTATPWGWVSGNSFSGTSMWVQYEWKSKVSINEWYIYTVSTTTRIMTGCEIQWWDGSAWKTAKKFTLTAATEYSLEFPTVNTTKIRMTNMTISGAQSSNPNFKEIECYYNSFGPNDAGVASIDSPYAFCAGTKDIYATISNYGINQIDTVTVNWTLDGTAQTAINYYGLLDTAGGTGSSTAQIKLGSATFGSTARDIVVWTSKPNNVADTVGANDTVSTNIKASLSGKFTIGGTGGDYNDVVSAAEDLTNFGVCGPVEFDIRPGTYTGHVELGEIIGASAINTISFVSPHRDSVTVQHTGTGLNATMNTIELKGTDWVSFENMTIEADGTYGFAVHLMNNADHNIFNNCKIQANPSVTSTYSIPIVFSGSETYYYTSGSNGNFNEFTNNDVVGGYFAMTCYGAGVTSPTKGNTFINNDFSQMYYYGPYMFYQDSCVFQDNVIDGYRSTAANYGAYFYYFSNFDIQRNYIKHVYYSYLYYSNYYNWNTTDNSIFANNTVISTGTSYAIYGYRMSRINFWHNSIYGKGSYLIYMPYGTGNDMRNNIFWYDGNLYALYLFNNGWDAWDYNDYVISGGNAAYINGSVYSSASALAGWNSNYNQNNWDLDPGWVDETDDHHLTSKFPDMYGPYVGVDDDIDGDARCKLISTIGPDEQSKVTLPPTANFLTPDTAWIGSPAIVLNSAAPSKTEGSEWYVNGSLVSDSLHLEYVPTNTGMDTIMLKQFNCSGEDSIVKYVYVSPVLRAPKVDFSSSATTIYTGETVRFLDLSANGATEWSWSASPNWTYSAFLGIRTRAMYWHDSTKANPLATFDEPGIYEICLKVGNSFGADSTCKTQYVIVRQGSVMCDVVSSTSADFGTLYDNGGALGAYTPGLNGIDRCTYLVESCKGEFEFDIDVFDLGDRDYLQVYDGSDANGKPLWNAAQYPEGMTGNKTDASVTTSFTASTGSAYFVFISDDNPQTVGKGFAIDWNLNPVTWVNPAAGISMVDTQCVGFSTVLSNASTGVYSDVEWDVENDGTIESYANEFSYTFDSVGTYYVRLKANSYCAGSDSIVDSIVIINAAKAPTPDFTASATKVNTGDTIVLSDLSSYCSNLTQWEISPSDYLLVNNTTLGDEEVQILFTRGGFYDIKLVKGNTFGKDSVIKTNHIQVLEYCTPSVVNLDDDLGISRVVFGSIDNSTSVGKSGYGNYLYMSTEVERGLSYPISIERASNNKNMTRNVWIDWNIDGDFDDPQELVSSEGISNSMVYNDTIVIPSAAVAGETRMRVGTNYKNLANIACGPHVFGEFEDYSIEISEFDRTAPTLTLDGLLRDTIEVFDTWVEPGYTAIDLLDGNITADVTVTNPLDVNVTGSYTIAYEVYDKSGNKAYKERVIVVQDTELPTITLNGADTVYVDVLTSYVEQNATAKDNYDNSPAVIITGNVDTAVLGNYSVQYCVTDIEGNGPVCISRVVIVRDIEDPIIALKGDAKVTIDQCGSYVDSGYTVTDNFIQSVTVGTSGTWAGSTDDVGTFDITYTATDGGGNSAMVTREIEVVDNVNPVLALNGNLVDTVLRWSEYTDAGVTPSDFCNESSSVSVETGGTFVNTQSPGVYTRTYEGEDASGNKSGVVQRIIVVVNPIGFGEIEFTDGLDLFPNPSTGNVTLSVAIENASNVDIRVFNINGQMVFSQTSVSIDNGSKVEMDLQNLSAGTYHVQINGDSVYSVKKLVISK